MTANDMIHDKIYSSLVDELGYTAAQNWAHATVRTYNEGVYDSIDSLINNNIQYALTGEEL